MVENNTSNKKGILLINLGTPASPRVSDVRRYLREFLSDPHVIDIPAVERWLLLNLLILPFRPFKAAKAYKKIWSDAGSPLLINSLQLRNTLSKTLGKDFHVTLGMRYGKPNIEDALVELKSTGCEEIAIIPLYPQYASSTTHSSLEKTEAVLDKIDYHPEITTLRSFYNHKAFIKAYADLIAPRIEKNKPDILLFSYHGLPVRHIEKSNCQHIKHCAEADTCPIVTSRNAHCYRAQCFATSRAIAKALNLDKKDYRVSFQSRLGRTPWIKPYTDELLVELADQDIKNIAIVCPSFVADCLETLEEIGIRGREQWRSLGGEELDLIPCLNSETPWAEGLKNIIITSC